MGRLDMDTKVISTMNPMDSTWRAAGHSDRFAGLAGLLDHLGRYVLLDRLGGGAFGTVWTAYDPQLDRRVAIKIVHSRARRETTADAARDELLSEAQLLAQLSHPNVVTIHDAGRLEDAMGSMSNIKALVGEDLEEVERCFQRADPNPDPDQDGAVGVFIVMEHLAGPTLAEWLVAEPPPALEDILRVFGEAGRGLAAAHARGLVHLDFKPANLMFGADGRVRVLDFGLARVGRRLRGKGRNSGRSRVAGTPAYMAPEQHQGLLADSRADQYAFCVSLWEAVYGERPFDRDDSKSVFIAKFAGPPSFTSLPPEFAHVHAALERGLAFDPERRFASMDELLAVLRDDPRQRRRSRIAALALVGGLVGAGFGLAQAAQGQTNPCALPPDQFAGVWDNERRAEVEAAFEATGVAFAADTFDQVATGLDQEIAHWSVVRQEVCRATVVNAEVPVERMSEQMLCLDRRLRAIAGLSETLLVADAEIVARARDSVLSLEDPDRCRADPRQDRGVLFDPARLALFGVEDALARSRVLGELGRYDAGLESAEQARTRATELGDEGGIGRAQRERGYLLRELGRHDEARDASRAALASAARRQDRELETTVLVDLIATETARGDFDRALAIRELLEPRIDAARTPELAVRVHLNAAAMHDRQQRWDQALAELDAATALFDARHVSSPALRGQVYVSYGNVLVGSSRDLDGGAAAYLQAIELWTDTYGDHHPLIAKTRMNLSVVYFRLHEYARAIELLESALAQIQQVYGADHPYVSVCIQNLGALRWATGEFHEAIAHTRESLRLSAIKRGIDHPDHATAERNLAALLTIVGEHREARPLFEHALSVYENSYDLHDSRRMALDSQMAEVAWWLGEYELARTHAAQAELALAQAEPTERRRIGPLSALALLELHEGKLEAAHAHARELVNFHETALDQSSPDLARERVLLAKISRELGLRDEAREQLALALAKLTRPDHSEHPFAWAVRLEMGRLALDEGQRALAIKQMEAALSLARGPEGAPVHAAIVELALADALAGDPGTRRVRLREHGRTTLADYGVRPDLLTP
ncbi:High-affnity carbon uptake protein Hat/HatR [Enhygromyxa salina]|uniref:High-affnity carbon uptake protein Hat/HatR n=1 Tax=Enhygromyxa salina TaxID=215803 RepID=A0A0C2D7B9_9BACT|nr:serine/threonine-protein kinase [Enhygromyxa salina]KIG15927.1 High-affnity carbon uptake protein Hat/HatR [Enhygromyxa salina]